MSPRSRLLARGAEEINGSAIEWLKRAASRRRPFFLCVNYMDAHAPCIPPEEFDRRFPGRDPRAPVDLADQLLVDMGNGRFPADPAAAPDDESTVLIVGDDGLVDEPADADRPDFTDDLDPADAP